MSDTATPVAAPVAAPVASNARQNVRAKVAALAGPAPAETSGEAPSEASGAPTTETGAADPEAAIRASRHQLLEEKLAAQREQRQASRLAERALKAKKEAEADRKAAADERASLQDGRKDFKKFFEANGMNAREAYEEMTRQAIEADTPEAQIKQLQESWKAEIEAQVAPLKSELEAYKQREAEYAAHVRQQKLVSDYNHAANATPDYQEIRIAYGDKAIFEKAQEFVKSPEFFYQLADKYGVPTGNGYGMKDILNVIKAARELEHSEVEERRARFSPVTQSTPGDTQSPKRTPTVNGTAARSNAGSTITNALASESASSGPPKLNRKERVEALVRRYERR